MTIPFTWERLARKSVAESLLQSPSRLHHFKGDGGLAPRVNRQHNPSGWLDSWKRPVYYMASFNSIN